MLESLSPSKQTPTGRRGSLYRYYAGYPTTFVASLLHRLDVKTSAVVLDPWNGAGTTTQVCAELGIKSIGIDANPFMRIVAQLRAASPVSIAKSVAVLEAGRHRWPLTDEVGAVPEVAAGLFRKLEDAGFIERDDPISCFAFASATRTVFESVRTRNPTWFSVRRSKAIRASESEISSIVGAELSKLKSWVSQGKIGSAIAAPALITGDARDAWIGRRVDHIISSPPYLTRIDYVKKTLPELLFLQELYGLDIDRLRRMMLGTVLTGRGVPKVMTSASATASQVLKKIDGHSSKASSTYYFKFFVDYFYGLEATLRNVVPLVKTDGTVTLVTQGSYYKEIYVDLPLIVVELMDGIGFVEADRHAFVAANHMAAINTRSFASTQEAPAEVVSTFRMKK